MTLEGIPKEMHQYVIFCDNEMGLGFQYEEKPTYESLVSRHVSDPFWTQELVEACARKHWIEMALSNAPVFNLNPREEYSLDTYTRLHTLT